MTGICTPSSRRRLAVFLHHGDGADPAAAGALDLDGEAELRLDGVEAAIDGLAIGGIADEQAELAQDADVDADEIIRAQQVRKLIASLPPKLREVILLHYYHDFSQKKIAEITGLAQGTVKSRLHRATLILRDKLEIRRTSVADLEVD